MTYIRGGSKRKLIVTLAYLPYDSDKPPRQRGYRKSLATAVGINCSSLLNVIPMHTTLYGGAWTSIHEENA
jgi:hypothetical protein